MTALFVLRDLGDGGIQLSVAKLLTQLRCAKHVALFTHEVRQPIPEDVELHVLQPPQRAQSVRWSHLVRLPFALRSLVRRVRPHVVVGFGYFPGLVAVAATRRLAARVRTVMNLRCSMRELYETRRRLSPTRLLTPWALGAADRLVAVSQAIEAELVAMGVESQKVVVIQNGFDVDAIAALARAEVEDPWFRADRSVPVIVGVGRLSLQKNFKMLIDALGRVRRVTPARLAIIGDGPEASKLVRFSAEKGLSDAVRLLGHQANPHAYVARADLFALTSLWEGFPNALCEAMIAGAPVISVDCPTGPSEIITHHKTGYLVQPATTENFANGIVHLLGDAATRQRMSAAGREHAAGFSISNMIAAYDQLIRELVDSLPASRPSGHGRPPLNQSGPRHNGAH